MKKSKIIGISNFTYEFYDFFFNIADNLILNGYKVTFLFPNETLKIVLKNRGYDFIENESYIIEKPYKIIFWETESLMAKKTLSLVKSLNIKKVFFENGYFPNTLQIDDLGQNKNSSIYKLSFNDIINYKRKVIKSKINVRINKFKLNIYEKVKILFNIKNTITSIGNFIKFKKLEKIRKKILNKEKNIILNKGNYVFIPFQVHDDSQILYNSKIIRKMDDILNFFYNDIKEVLPEYKIVVKEHPMDLGRIDYSYLRKKYNDIIWFQGGNLDDIINKSDYVILVNSSVGIQSLEKGKKILLLGDTLYENNPFIEKITEKKDFKEKLINLKNKEINLNELNKYINSFKNEIFINGNYKKIEKESLLNILNIIINN